MRGTGQSAMQGIVQGIGTRHMSEHTSCPSAGCNAGYWPSHSAGHSARHSARHTPGYGACHPWRVPCTKCRVQCRIQVKLMVPTAVQLQCKCAVHCIAWLCTKCWPVPREGDTRRWQSNAPLHEKFPPRKHCAINICESPAVRNLFAASANFLRQVVLLT